MHHYDLYFKCGLIAIIAGLVDNCHFSTSSKYRLYTVYIWSHIHLFYKPLFLCLHSKKEQYKYSPIYCVNMKEFSILIFHRVFTPFLNCALHCVLGFKKVYRLNG